MDQHYGDQQFDGNARERKSVRKTVCIVLAIVVVIVACLLCTRCSSCSSDTTTTTLPEAPEIDPDAGEYVEPEPTESEPGVVIPGWVTLSLPAGTTEVSGTVDFYNPEDNADWYYLTFELLIPDEESETGYESVYKSGLIAPGLHVQSITLDRPLEAGTYDAYIHVQPYRMDDKSPTSNADLAIELNVG